jgi:hypothetical protein
MCALVNVVLPQESQRRAAAFLVADFPVHASLALDYDPTRAVAGGAARSSKQGTTKMLERTIAFLGTQACVMALAWAAWSDEVPDNYLPGTWGIGGAKACGAATTEHITFKPDGTFEATGDGQATAVGFWHLVEDVLDLHMLSSPAFFDDPATDIDNLLSDLAGQYEYFYAKGLLFDVEPDGFRMVASMGNTLRGANYRRCP